MKNFFSQISYFLENCVAPVSHLLDSDENLLKNAYAKLIELNGLKLLIPSEYGGIGGERREWIEYNILMAQYSGALLFLQAQHQLAVSQLKKLLPQRKVIDLLQLISKSNLGLGVALAANRKLLQVKKINGGFELSGKLLWVTGFNYFSSALLSFDQEENIYYAILPFNSHLNTKSISISPIIETVVFSSTNTVTIILDNYFISDHEIIAIQPVQPKVPMQHPAVYNFSGAAKALLKIAMEGKYHHHAMAKQKYSALSNEWEIYYDKIVKNKCCPLKLRAQGFLLSAKCLNFARMVVGAESILSSHAINRINREIWQYSVAGYSEDQLNAYLIEIL